MSDLQIHTTRTAAFGFYVLGAEWKKHVRAAIVETTSALDTQSTK